MLPKRVGYSHPWKILPKHFYFYFYGNYPSVLNILNLAYTKIYPNFGCVLHWFKNISTFLGLSRDKTKRQPGKNASLTLMYNIAYIIELFSR